MQLVLSKNRIIAHGENFLTMGGAVINTETGAKYEHATIAECNGCPSDIDKVGYEYHGGVFTPCAPYGTGDNNGFFMEVCADCATPRSSGIPIIGGIKAENINESVRPSMFGGMDITLLWENASPTSEFAEQTIALASEDFTFLLIEAADELGESSRSLSFVPKGTPSFIRGTGISTLASAGEQTPYYNTWRYVYPYYGAEVIFGTGYRNRTKISEGGSSGLAENDSACIPIKIYGVKL